MNRNRYSFIKNSRLSLIVVILLIGVSGILLLVGMKKKPIRIGLAAQLTGKQAELGVQERNGALLAVETINVSGGIDGRKIQLVIRDDFGIPEQAKLADRELIESGVAAIIGHATSEQTLAGLEVTNPANIVMIGATASTPELSGLDDYFFRVYPSFKESAQTFAQYIYQQSGIKRMAIIYDDDNTAYAKTYSAIFTDKFQYLGGEIVGEISFSSVTQPDFQPLLLKLHEDNVDGLLIIASDIDTALIAQRTCLMGWQIPLFSSHWAQTETLINNGGQAVEGMKMEQSYTFISQSPTFIDFQSRYQVRFGNAPSFGAALAYDAVMVLREGLEKTEGGSEGLKQALLQIQNFQGLTDTFSFDEFGDVRRPFSLCSIRNGKFVILDPFTSNRLGGE
ncbi:MAG: ABC transporter substrate-binding protein [Bacillota bacterium]